jgi:5-methylcytosine-specific restriction enzyme A
MRYCSVPRCGVVVRKGRCPQHAQLQQQREDRFKTGPTRYDTMRWRRLRAAMLAEQPLCVRCAQIGRVTVAGVVDHIRPHRGDEDLMYDTAFLDGRAPSSNLQPLCATCHGLKTAAETWRR